MEIQSAFASGVQGFQKATEDASKAAAEIASSTFNSNPSVESQNVDNLQASPSTTQDLPDLNQEVVNLKVAEYQAKASAEVIQSADESLGTLLDVTA